ncbi:MAG: hypothetical protein ABEI52_01965 [Halobacteriaceae archaeon]
MTNVSDRFDRVPPTKSAQSDRGRPTRSEVVDYFEQRFEISRDTFDNQSFWEKGAGKIWTFSGHAPDPLKVESLGLPLLRTRQEHWKPTTNGVQRFGRGATKNVLKLSALEGRKFLAGETQQLKWDGDWGYLIISREIAGVNEPLGVGLYTHGELKSMMPKGRRRYR